MFIHFAPTPPKNNQPHGLIETAEPLDLQVNEILEHFGPYPDVPRLIEAEPGKNRIRFWTVLLTMELLGCPRELGSMVSKWVITYSNIGYIEVTTH